MTGRTALMVLWLPRVLGCLVAAFIGLFALDAFGPGKGILESIVDFTIHLVPSAVVLAVVAIAWRRPWAGAVAFLALAIAYGMMVRWRMDWVLAISGPLAVVGVLFLWSWRSHAPLRTAR